MFQRFFDIGSDLVDVETDLRHGIAVADGDGIIFQRIEVDSDAERCSDLILTAVAFSDRACLVVSDHEFFREFLIHFARLFGKVFLQRQDGRFVSREGGVEVHDGTYFAAFEFFFLVRFAKDSQHESVGADGVFHDVGDILLVGDGVEVIHILARIFLVAGEVVIGAVVDAVEFRPADREEVLDIAGRFRVMREFVVIFEAQVFFLEAEAEQEVFGSLFIFFVVLKIGAFFAEPLVFHLFELDGAENEVSGGDFVAERFADLRDAERHFCARGALNVQKVYEFALRGFGAQVDFILALVGDAAGCFEHKVERTDGRPVMFAAVRAGDFVFFDVGFHFLVGHGVGIDLAFGMRFDQIICAEACFAFFAVHFRVGKGSGVAACFPHAGIH